MNQSPGPAQRLRAAIDLLPAFLKRAVLDGIGRRPILAGADDDGEGGSCPMLAADVCWDDVDPADVRCAQDVAWAWDDYAGATRSSWHRASSRHLLALRSMLEASLIESDELAAPPRVYHSQTWPCAVTSNRSVSGLRWRARAVPASHCSQGRSRGSSRAAAIGS